jgi:hypothetical protein
MSSTVWIFAAAAISVLVGIAFVMLWRSGSDTRNTKELPNEWPLVPRSLFTLPERELNYRLRAALPDHVVLAKVALVRFCQPQQRKEMDYWFNLLGPLHVSFVVCSEAGRVLAALDIERADGTLSRRAATIKQAVLATCRVRYLKCSEDQLPTVADLRLLVPSLAEAGRPGTSGAGARDARATLAHAVRARRGEHHVQWYESSYNQDSFFTPDSRMGELREPGSAPRGELHSLAAARQNRARPVEPQFRESDPDSMHPDPGESPWLPGDHSLTSARPDLRGSTPQVANRRR